MTHPPAEVISQLRTQAREILSVWNAEDLMANLTLEYSDRMTRSLGRCLPERSIIRLRSDLAAKDAASIRREVLAHELAHLVAHHRCSGSNAPHGATWRELITAAGYSPRLSAPGLEGCRSATMPKQTPSTIYVHRCLVCGMERRSRLVVKAWKCAACVEAGLDGQLEVVSVREDDGV